MLAQLPDGSFLSMLAGLKVRIIDAEVIATLADGRRVQGRYRLVGEGGLATKDENGTAKPVGISIAVECAAFDSQNAVAGDDAAPPRDPVPPSY